MRLNEIFDPNQPPRSKQEIKSALKIANDRLEKVEWCKRKANDLIINFRRRPDVLYDLLHGLEKLVPEAEIDPAEFQIQARDIKEAEDNFVTHVLGLMDMFDDRLNYEKNQVEELEYELEEWEEGGISVDPEDDNK